MNRRQLLTYLALAMIWGWSFVLLLKVVAAFGWVGAVSLRALIASVVLLTLARLSRRRLVFGDWRALAVVGATTVAGQLIGLNVATPRIGTAMAAIFVGTIPLFSMLIGQAWGLERLTRTGVVGLVLGFGGIVALVGFPANPVTPTFILGCAASIFGALCAAFGSNYAHKRLRDIGSWEQTIGAFLAAGLMTLPLLTVVPFATRPAAMDYLYLLLLAATCSSLAYVLYFRLVAEVGATVAISVEFAVTAVAVAVGSLVLGEHLSLLQLVGAIVILVGCSLVLGLIPGLRPRGTARPAPVARSAPVAASKERGGDSAGV